MEARQADAGFDNFHKANHNWLSMIGNYDILLRDEQNAVFDRVEEDQIEYDSGKRAARNRRSRELRLKETNVIKLGIDKEIKGKSYKKGLTNGKKCAAKP